jgi:catechol 2,3-dioxygenase-like lactoylglutathione lyase family enzyme
MQLNQVTLPSRDLARAVPFYQRLGFRLIVDSVPRYARFECGDLAHAATFSLHHVDRLPGEGVVVYFECEDLDGTVERLQAAGIVFESDPVDQRWLWREAYLRDPDGNRLCLYQPGENRRFPPWRVEDG